jgi:hypothetical protein
VIGGTGASIPIEDWVGPGMNEEGKLLGTCVGTVWTNPANKKQTGAKVHPHCIRGYEYDMSQQVEAVSLASISARHFFTGSAIEKLELDDNGENLLIQYQPGTNQRQTQGKGLLVAYGQKGLENEYGKFVIDLSSIVTARYSGINLLAGECYVGEEEDLDARLDSKPETVEEWQETTDWLRCVAETDEDGDIVLDSEGNYKGAVTASFYEDVNADHDPDSEDFVEPDQTVKGYLFWKER